MSVSSSNISTPEAILSTKVDDQARIATAPPLLMEEKAKQTKRGKPKGKPKDAAMELRSYSHDAYRVLGENYLIREWLPRKGPFFVALIQAMRAHIYWDYKNGDQQTTFVPEAATIATWAKMSRSMVFKMLNEPDMDKFIVRVNRRRYDDDEHREVQTSNLYYVVMEDPPATELDRQKVEREQKRIDTIDALRNGKMSAKDAQAILGELDELDAAAKTEEAARKTPSKRRKPSESTAWTLKGVHSMDSVSSTPGGHEDRFLLTNFDNKVTSITQENERPADVVPMAIGNRTEGREDEIARGTESARSRSREADRIRSEPDKSAAQRSTLAVVPTMGVGLTEGEAWRADARGWLETTRLPARPGEKNGPTVLEHQMTQFRVENTESALSDLLAFAAPRLAPTGATVETLADLAANARRRADIYVWRVDPETQQPKYPNPGGYYIGVLQSLIKEFAKARNMNQVESKTAALERSAQAKARVEQGQSAEPPKLRPTRSMRGAARPAPTGQRGETWPRPAMSVEEQLRAALHNHGR